jgi:diacylglycerol O-acyltransferase / wax synthase
MTNREKISGVDTAWLRMEHPTNLMMIVGVMMFDRKVRLRDVKRILRARWLGFRRFRQKAVHDAAGAWWEEDAGFDMDAHLVRATLPGKAGKRELEALVSRLASTPLDSGRPLWQFHLVENYTGASALIARIHHCYADGIALIQVMLSMTHPSPEGSLDLPAEEIQAPAQSSGDLLSQLLKPFGALEGFALQDVARKGVDFAGEVAKLLLMGRDSPTRFKGALGARKKVVWAEPLPLRDVKAVGKALGCSINDVLLSMAAGALRDYLIDKGDRVEGVDIRAIVPVNLRPIGDGRSLGNHFGLVFLDLPLGMDHPLERLYEVRRRMGALKGSYQPLIALGLLSAVGYGPKVLQEQVTQMLGNNASAVMTNVPGPQHALYFAGRRIVELDFWVPQSGGIGMGVSILSYDGRIQFGVMTDAGLIPDPGRIVGRFADEFDKLLWITLMSPWGEATPEAGPDGPTTGVVPAQAGTQSSKIPRRFRNL